MPAIGITGGISTGKSTFVECLREVLPEATFFDADAAVHKLFDRPEVQKDIQREFGTRVFSTVGDLNRAKLRAIVFSDATKKCALERILHPRIQWQKSIVILPIFSLLIFHSFMRPAVKRCATEWSWWRVRRRCS